MKSTQKAEFLEWAKNNQVEKVREFIFTQDGVEFAQSWQDNDAFYEVWYISIFDTYVILTGSTYSWNKVQIAEPYTEIKYRAKL